ncbi:MULTISPECIES: FAD-dependent oxidoreductase [unclassified Roseitalea]|uniref:NAD(P)/FAD-dependent oxidoreductase n=1 Tax=unclassified Roseitalea TaxID=2639107 RepID=UPI00273EDE22|nr:MULTISPECIES: FAD-dependent oxidoreductase [unclassified Roseitalea]
MNIKPAPGQFELAGIERRIAVIGSGIAGVSAAWSLSFTRDVTLFEADARPGGHTCTIDVDHDGTHIPVDVGFIVFNERNYPELCALFDHLGIACEDTNMSFSLSLDRGRREWCGQDYLSVFAQKRNALSPGFLWMIREILRFNRQARADRDAGRLAGLSIGAYLERRGFSARFRDDYLIPMAAAIWSTPKVRMLDFPALTFVQFFENHRLLETRPPLWRTVSGGARNYLDKMLARLDGRVRVATPVARIERPADGGAIVTTADGERTRFDAVVIAAHSDQALAMLADADANERDILSAIPYRPNRAVLHRDPGFMPRRKRAWAAWNYLRESARGEESDICVTYWMNRLQNIDPRYPLFVSLNPSHEPAPGTVFGEWSFDHPQYDARAFAAQARLSLIQGRRAVWFAGAWTGYGFHEDGLRSGLAAAEALGGHIPWRGDLPDLSMPVAAE